MYTRFLKSLINKISRNRKGHCTGDGGDTPSGGSGHCS